MSREWYIKTDTRHVQDTFGDIDTTVPTAKEKWKRHYKKYILWIIEGIVAFLIILIPTVELLKPAEYDYTLTLVTALPLSSERQKALTDALCAVGEDVDGDGRVNLSLRALTVSEELKNATLQREMLLTSFLNDDYRLFVMEPACYEELVAPHVSDDFFAVLQERDGLLFAARSGDAAKNERALLARFLEN